jgi:hypothetical protein
MELMKEQYFSVMLMPIDRFYQILKHKDKFDREVQKVQKDELDKLS